MFTRSVFEKKTEKRNLELHNANKIKRLLERRNFKYSKGNVVCLCGPCVKEHYDILYPLTDDKSFVAFAEMNKKVVKINDMWEQMYDILNNTSSPRIDFLQGNVWDLIKDLEPQKQADKRIVYFDLDFTLTPESLIRQHNLLQNLRAVAVSKSPKATGFGLSISACLRKSKYGVRQFSRDIVKCFEDNSWFARNYSINPYQESVRGSPMVNFLYFFIKNREYHRKRIKG